ncbi:RICIN domain-containing protein [Streptosporangium sp. NPDC002721]|uniref:RICIN domain-containing protein n=1 Tax=Streptosporangium sp. NPDC002721 TaxID=3366188 RepID=UPI00367F0689
MKLFRAVHTLTLAGTLISVPFTVMPAAAVVSADAPERLRAGFQASLVARHSGKCLDVDGASRADGANVIQWTCRSQPNQKWDLVATDSGYYTLRAAHSGKCLDVDGASRADGANIIQWTCQSQPNQQWRLVQKDNEYFALVSRHSGKCLDVDGASKADGANIIQWTCQSQPNQQWRLV